MKSQVLEQKLVRKSKADSDRAGEIARHVREAISQTRSLARGLSPVTLESEGLISALHELAANAERMFGMSCHIEAPQTVPLQAPAVTTHLYRIAQEAVSNAIKHGKAKEVTIRLTSEPERVLLQILDKGVGLCLPLAPRGGMGLSIMRYRAGMIGASFSIENGPAGGAIVTCSVPLA